MPTRPFSRLGSPLAAKPRPLSFSLAGLRSTAAVCAALLAAAPVVRAAAVSWDGGASDLLWTSAVNWSPDGVPLAADDLTFGLGGAGIIDLAGNQSANSLAFSSNGFTLGLAATANTLTLGVGGNVTVNPAITGAINAVLAGANGLNKSGTGTLVLTAANTYTTGTTISAGTLVAANALALGATSGAVAVNATLQLSGGITLDNGYTLSLNNGGIINSNGTNSISSNINVSAVASSSVTLSTTNLGDVFTVGNGANDITGGSATAVLHTSGSGTILVANGNNYLGGWSVDAGTLQLGGTAALGTSGTAKVTLNGGNLSGHLASSTIFTGPAANGLVVTANSTLTSDRSTAGAGVTYTYGPLSIGGQTLTTAVGSNVTSGTGGLAVGAVTLTGAPIFTLGASTLLTMAAVTGTNQNIIFNGTGSATITGVIGTGTGAVTVSGGTVTLSNTGNTFTGAVNVDGTGVVVVPGNAGGLGDPTALGSGSKAVNLTNGGTVRFTSNSNPTNTNTKMFTIGAGGGKIDTGIVTVTLDDNTGATAQLQGSGDLTKLGTGILQLGYSGQVAGGFSGYTGNIIINAGTLQAGNANGLGSTSGTTTVNSGGALDFYSSSATYAENINIIGTGPAGNGALTLSTAFSIILNGTLTMTGNSALGVTSTSPLTVNGVVSGGFDLTKVGTGAGILNLANAANTYTGLTTIAAGTLAGTNIANVGGGNTSFGNVTTGAGGTFAIGGTAAGVLQVNALTASSTDRVINLAGTTFNGGVASSGTAPVTFTSNLSVTGVGAKQFTLGGTNAENNTFSGVIANGSGTIGLDKSGAGTWLLPAGTANTYTGTTNLTGGVLWINNNASLGDVAAGTVQSGASELRLSGGLAVGAETLSIAGGGINNFGALRNYADNNSWAGAITLAIQSRINSDSGTLTLSNTVTGANFGLVVGGAGNLTLNGALNFGTGILSKSDGTGVLTLNVGATHTGVTTINAGKLLLGPGGNFLGVTAATVASGATLAVGQNASATTNSTAGALTLSAGALFTMADGFTSTFNVAGATTFGGTSASTLTFDLGGATTTADLLASNGAAVISAAGGAIAINTIGATPLALSSYNLITGGAGSTLATNPFTLTTTKVYVGATPYTLSLTSAATSVALNVAAFAGLDTAYWKGDVSGLWNVTGADTNWDTTEGGGIDTLAIPTSVTDVFFHATGAGNLTNTLGQDFTINSLSFTAASSAVTIGAGNTLTLAAGSTGNIGLNVASGAALQTINAPILLGQSQTWNQASANTLTVGGNVGGAGTLTKTGTGTIVLSGALDNNAGGLTINGGAINLTGTYNPGNATAGLTLGNASGTSLLRINGGNLVIQKSAAPGIVAGTTVGGVGAINLSSGTVNVLAGSGEVWIGSAAGAYGALTITGGTATFGSWLAVGRGGNGALNVTGGNLNVLTNNITVGTIGGGSGNTNDVVNFSGNSTTTIVAGGLLLPEQQAGHFVVANLSGSAVLSLGTGVSFGSGGAQVNTGILNLNGGTLITKSILKGTGTGTYLLNFNGGTLKAQLGAVVGIPLAGTGSFLGGGTNNNNSLTSAYVNSGGAIFDTNGQNITVVQALLAPVGNGVTATGLTLGGTNSGYIDTPVVSITGGGGTGATAVADLDYATGVITGITITNRGNGYTSAPTFSLLGGGGAATIGGSALLVANNTTGGLTKNGAGTLELSATTYTGATTVNGGGIIIGASAYPATGITFAAGTSLGFTGSGATNFTVPQNLTLTTAITRTSGLSPINVINFTGTNSFPGLVLNPNNGAFQFDSAAALGLTAGRSVVDNSNVALNYATPLQAQLVGTFNGLSVGALALTALNDATQNLDFSAASGANQTGLSLGVVSGQSVTYTGTITPNAGVYRLGGGTGTLTLPGTNALTGSNSLNIHGPAGGTVILGSTNNYTGGTTFVGNSAVLNFVSGALGSGNVSFSAPNPNLQWAAGNTQDISASRTITINANSTFNADTNGNNVTFASPIGNFGAGGLLKVGGGNLTLSGVNTYTGGTAITGGTLILANGALINSNVNLTVANSLVLGGATATIGGLTGGFVNNTVLAETILAGSTLTIGANNSAQTYSGALAATTGGITKIGAATQTFSGANLYTGATTIQMGNLTSGQLVSSVLNLSFAANQTNRLSASTPLVLGGSVATDAQTILGGGTLLLTGIATSTNSQTVAGLTVGVGNNNLVLSANATANPLALTLGAITRNTGGTLHITQPTGTLSATNGVQTTTGTASTLLTSAAGTAYATIGANAAGAYDWAGKDAGNAFIAPVTYLTAGTNVLYATSTPASNTDVTAAYTASGATTVGTLRFNNAAVANIHNLGGFITTVDKGGVLFGGTANQTINTGTLKPGAGNELVFINTNTGVPQISAVLADGGATSSVTYRALIGATGTGQFAVTGTNTYTGPTYITSGRIQTGTTAQPFGTGALAKVYVDGNTNGQWFASGTATVANPFLITGNGWSESGGPFGAIRIDGTTLTGGVTLLGDAGIGVNTGTGTINSAVSGAFNLTKLVAGNLVLTGTNTLTGKYVANAGTLTFGSAGAYGTATGLALTGGTVTTTLTNLQTNLINRLTPLNAVTALNGTIGVTAATVAENVDFTNATLDLSNVYLGASAGVTYTGTITPYNNAYKIGGGGNTITFGNTNAFVDNGATPRSLTTRNNTVILSGTNSYTGGTTASATLQFANGGLGSGPITLSGGTLAWAIGGNTQDVTAGGRVVTLTGNANTLDTFGNNVTLSGPLALNTTNATTKAGGGVLTLTGVSTTNATSPTFTNSVAGLTLGTANALPVYTNLNNVLTAGVITTLNASQTVGSIGGIVGTANTAIFAIGGNTLTYGYNNASPGVDSLLTSTAAGALIKVGTGSQFFRVQSTGYLGSLTVNNGFQILEFAQIAANTTNILPATTQVTLGGGTLYTLGRDAAGTSIQNFTNNVILNPGASGLGTQPRVTGAPTMTLNINGFTRNTGGTVNVYPIGAGSSFTPTFGTLGSVTTNQSNTDYSGAGGNLSILAGYAAFSGASGATTPTTWAVSTNGVAAVTTITGLATFSSTYTAGTNVDSAVGNVSTGASALTVNSLRFNSVGAYQVDATNGLSIASGGILATAAVAANPIAILNGTLTSGNAQDLIIHHYATGDFTIGSQITGSIGLTKSGTGRLILTNAANNYSGTTYVNQGTLRYNVSATPGSTAALVHSGAAIELIDGVTITGQTATLSGVGIGGNGALVGAYGTSTWAGNVVIGDIEARIGVAAVSTLNINGVISDGAAANGVLNNKIMLDSSSGTGTIVLNGSNTYTGSTNIIRGYVKLGSSTALPSAAALDVHSGGQNFGLTATQATLDLNGYNATVTGLTRTDTTGSGTITNWTAGTSTLTLNNATANTYSGTITEAYGKIAFIKSGAGNLTLSGSNSFSGGLTINGGTVFMGNANALGSQAQPNALTMTGGTLDASGIASINVNALSGTAGTITDSGILVGTTTLNSNSTTNETFAGNINDGLVRNLSYVKSGSGIETLTGTTNGYTGATAITAGTLSIGGAGRLNSGAYAGNIINNGILDYASTASQTLSGSISGSGALRKSTASTLTLTGTNSFTGNVTIDGGTVIAGGNQTSFALGSPTFAGRTVTVNSGATLSLITNNVFGDGVGNSNLPAVILNSATLTSTRYNVLGNLTLNGSTLTQAATDGPGAYEGYQFRGTVTVGGSSASTITATTGRANHLGPNTNFIVADATGDSAADLTVSAALKDQSGDFVSAAGALTKSGAGTMVLTGTNTYTGTTTVSNGTLQLGNGGATGSLSPSSTITNNGTLAFNRSNAATQGTDFANGISGSGGVVQAGGGTTTFNSANSYMGTTLISAGTLQIGSGGTTGSLSTASTITNNSTLTFNRSNALTQGTDFANGIGGTGSVVQAGSGTTTLSGTNAYGGATTVSAGTLAVSGSLSATTAVNINAGTLLLGSSNVINNAASMSLGGGTFNTGGFSDTLGALTLTATSTIDFGAGNASELTFTTLTLGGNSLNIWNWTATNPNVATGTDTGTAGDGLRDRLVFTTLGSLSTTELSQIHFFSGAGAGALGDGRQISFGGNQELVPVPEPTTIFGALALVGLVGYRERRRLKAAKGIVGGWMSKAS